MPAPGRFLTIGQAAELNVPESQIWSVLGSGELKDIQIGGRGYLVPNPRRASLGLPLRGTGLNLAFGFCRVCKDRMGYTANTDLSPSHAMRSHKRNRLRVIDLAFALPRLPVIRSQAGSSEEVTIRYAIL